MNRFLLYLILITGPLWGFAQQPQQMKKDFTIAFSKGETAVLKTYFKGFVNMNIPGEKGFFSESKAWWLLQDFFQHHKVTAFSVKEDGFSGDNYYLIGEYGSGQSRWNIYFLFSPGEENFQIQQIDIELNRK